MAKRKPVKGDKQPDPAKAIAADLLKCQLAWQGVPTRLAKVLIRGI